MDLDNAPDGLESVMLVLKPYLSEDFASMHCEREHKQAKELLSQRKKAFMKYAVLQHELKELLAGGLLKNPKDKTFTTLREALSLAELPNVIQCDPDPTQNRRLLTVSPEDTLTSLQELGINRYIPFIVESLEGQITKQYDALAELGGGVFGDVEQNIDGQLQRVEHSERELKHAQKQYRKQFTDYVKLLVRTCTLLQQLLKDFRFKGCESRDTVMCDWLVAKADALRLKIKLKEIEIECETYTQQTVEALKSVRHHLDVAVDTAATELLRSTQSLNAYRSVGSELDTLAREYASINAEIENKRWSMRNLQSAMSGDS